jgi:dinuclear metal center YbgI/SA1388 family protein
MSVILSELCQFLDRCLEPGRFRDYCPNGLQVQGREQVSRIVTGVTASQRLLDAAVDWRADAILVHHGYFWKGESAPVVGMKRRRLATLLANDISLLAYHLPLDAHPTLGNNARLGQLLGLTASEPLQHEGEGIGSVADLEIPLAAAELAGRLASVTGRSPLHVPGGDATLRRIAWCTGAAQGYIEAAVTAGADAFITGEASEPTVHVAREEGIHFFAAGHHATERYGIQALGEHLAETFPLEHRFIDIDNPV